MITLTLILTKSKLYKAEKPLEFDVDNFLINYTKKKQL